MVLPVEIIYQIISFLDPVQLIQLQTVSKQFHTILNHRRVWWTSYQHAHFSRPSGPFPWQSTRFLQRTLVRSARIADTWTSQPMKVLSSRQVFREESPSVCWWVSKRWLICERGTTDIVSLNIDTGTQQILWTDDLELISNWATCSIISAQGHLVYLALGIINHGPNGALKLLDFQADNDSGYLSGPLIFQVDAPPSFLKGELYLGNMGGASFIQISADMILQMPTLTLIYDIRGRAFYKFPHFSSQMVQPLLTSSPYGLEQTKLLSTINHIIVSSELYSYNGNLPHSPQIIQAFIIPEDPVPDASGIPELRLSHETTHGRLDADPFPIHPSFGNTLDGSTMLRFLHYQEMPKLQFFHTDFSLPPSRDNVVLPISVDTHEIFAIDEWNDEAAILTCDGGFVRGFYAGTPFLDDKLVLHTFSIDATGEKCVATMGSPSSPEPATEWFDWGSVVHWLDVVRGKLCYTRKVDDDTVTVIVDIG